MSISQVRLLPTTKPTSSYVLAKTRQVSFAPRISINSFEHLLGKSSQSQERRRYLTNNWFKFAGMSLGIVVTNRPSLGWGRVI